MKEILVKFNKVLNRKQKSRVIVLIIMILIGAVLETLGVSMIYPLVEAVMMPETFESNALIVGICSIFGFSNSTQFVTFMLITLIFVFIFIGMAFAGGVSLWWFALAIGGIAVLIPFAWPFLGTYQQERIMVLIDPTFDAQGIGARYHSKINLLSLTGGGLTGQGLFGGNRTQGGYLFAQHTDYIFSSMGEELGFVGCVFIMILELAIIARCIYVGIRCQDYMRRLVCYGAASALMFQLMINVGMCIGVMPVIGLTLPLISYGGSSVVTIFAMLGLVSGAYARPASLSHERYVQPYRG